MIHSRDYVERYLEFMIKSLPASSIEGNRFRAEGGRIGAARRNGAGVNALTIAGDLSPTRRHKFRKAELHRP